MVYYLYEKKYNLSNFLDTKTILQVLGTLGGAFYGAKIAGNHATNIAKLQMDQQTNKEKEINHNNKIRYLFKIFTKLKIGLYASIDFEEQFKSYFIVENKIKFYDVLLKSTMNEITEIDNILKSAESVYLGIDEISDIHNLHVILNSIKKLCELGVDLIERDSNYKTKNSKLYVLAQRQSFIAEQINISFELNKKIKIFDKLINEFNEKPVSQSN